MPSLLASNTSIIIYNTKLHNYEAYKLYNKASWRLKIATLYLVRVFPGYILLQGIFRGKNTLHALLYIERQE